MNILYLIISQLEMFYALRSEKMNHCFVNYLYLSFGLWMESNTPLQDGVHHSPKYYRKLSKESSVSIRDNGRGKSKMDPYMLKEKMSSFSCNDFFFA